MIFQTASRESRKKVSFLSIISHIIIIFTAASLRAPVLPEIMSDIRNENMQFLANRNNNDVDYHGFIEGLFKELIDDKRYIIESTADPLLALC